MRYVASARSTVAGPSAVAPSAAKPPPPGCRTVSSPRCLPSGSITVISSPWPSSTAVTAPGRTRYRSSRGSAGTRPGRISRGRSVTVTAGSPSDRLLGLALSGLGEQLLGQRPLPLGVQLLGLVGDRALVDVLVPVVEHLEAEQRGLADELAQHLVGRAHHPAGLAVAQVALDLQFGLVACAAAGMQHLVGDVGDVLGGGEFELPQPMQQSRAW